MSTKSGGWGTWSTIPWQIEAKVRPVSPAPAAPPSPPEPAAEPKSQSDEEWLTDLRSRVPDEHYIEELYGLWWDIQDTHALLRQRVRDVAGEPAEREHALAYLAAWENRLVEYVKARKTMQIVHDLGRPKRDYVLYVAVETLDYLFRKQKHEDCNVGVLLQSVDVSEQVKKLIAALETTPEALLEAMQDGDVQANLQAEGPRAAAVAVAATLSEKSISTVRRDLGRVKAWLNQQPRAKR